jgi:RNA polymerase sigma factor (sigma-70 family)
MTNRHDNDGSKSYIKGEVGSTDFGLLGRLRSGNDKEANDEFCKRYYGFVRWLLLQKQRSISRVERQEIATEVFIKALKTKFVDVHGQPIKKLRAWLRTVTNNTFNDLVTARGRLKQVDKDSSDSGKTDFFETLPDRESSWESIIKQSTRLIVIDEIIEQIKPNLKDGHWEVFRLTIYEGKKPKEVAGITNEDERNVRQIKNRILAHIRQWCKKLDDDLGAEHQLSFTSEELMWNLKLLLDDDYREVHRLLHETEYTIKEIADKLRLNENIVRQIVAILNRVRS